MSRARYSIGIDLGTSNCALSYVDRLEETPTVRSLGIAQCDENFALIERPTLPSFLYFLQSQEQSRVAEHSAVFSHSSDFLPGEIARQKQFENPHRVVHSAKSWLVHTGVDRTDKFLPWRSEEVASENRLSPVDVSAEYLLYLKKQWEEQFATATSDYALSHQSVVITVPASFDESAQQLTLQAARQAGFPESVRLLEEPQAAFYHWLSSNDGGKSAFTELFNERQAKTLQVLVCDVGGGTTDFSLFQVKSDGGSGGLPQIERVRVSDHILLGGDNIDLSLAMLAAEQVDGGYGELSRAQWHHLVAQCRRAKEKALQSAESKDVIHLAIPGAGSNLFESTKSVQIRTSDLVARVLQGFFPICSSDEATQEQDGAFEEFGLPYARDSRVTAHLAQFLNGKRVDAVLYTGGTLKPAFLRKQLNHLLQEWQPDRPPVVLVNQELDLAVAHGASWYGDVLQRKVGRIRGGYPRTVYLEAENSKKAGAHHLICIIPQGTEAGANVDLSGHEFQLRLDAPARFQLHVSTERASDREGELFALQEFRTLRLPPLETVLKRKDGMKRPPGGLLDVQLRVNFSETGMLQLYVEHNAEDRQFSWELAFELRRSRPETCEAETVEALHVDHKKIDRATEQIRALYGKGKESSKVQIKPGRLVQTLEKTLGCRKSEWDLPSLRALWKPLAEGVTRRGRSLQHERTWLNLAGYLLRPGFGEERDSVRLIQLWRAHELGLRFPKEKSVQVQWWVMWRRVAGGLDRTQQREIFEKVRAFLTKKNESPEAIRLVGSLERLPLEEKEQFGDMLVERILSNHSKQTAHYCWALGRVGARTPFHAPSHTVLPSAVVERWYGHLKELDWSQGELRQLIGAFSAAARLVGDSELNVSQEILRDIHRKLSELSAPDEFLMPLSEVSAMNERETAAMFGEALPSGILLRFSN